MIRPAAPPALAPPGVFTQPSSPPTAPTALPPAVEALDWTARLQATTQQFLAISAQIHAHLDRLGFPPAPSPTAAAHAPAGTARTAAAAPPIQIPSAAEVVRTTSALEFPAARPAPPEADSDPQSCPTTANSGQLLPSPTAAECLVPALAVSPASTDDCCRPPTLEPGFLPPLSHRSVFDPVPKTPTPAATPPRADAITPGPVSSLTAPLTRVLALSPCSPTAGSHPVAPSSSHRRRVFEPCHSAVGNTIRLAFSSPAPSFHTEICSSPHFMSTVPINFPYHTFLFLPSHRDRFPSPPQAAKANITSPLLCCHINSFYYFLSLSCPHPSHTPTISPSTNSTAYWSPTFPHQQLPPPPQTSKLTFLPSSLVPSTSLSLSKPCPLLTSLFTFPYYLSLVSPLSLPSFHLNLHFIMLIINPSSLLPPHHILHQPSSFLFESNSPPYTHTLYYPHPILFSSPQEHSPPSVYNFWLHMFLLSHTSHRPVTFSRLDLGGKVDFQGRWNVTSTHSVTYTRSFKWKPHIWKPPWIPIVVIYGARNWEPP